MVVRLYEPHGSRGFARLWWDPRVLPVVRVAVCNLLEDEEGELQLVPCVRATAKHEELQPAIARDVGDDMRSEVEVRYSPFKVITLKLYVATQPGKVTRQQEGRKQQQEGREQGLQQQEWREQQTEGRGEQKQEQGWEQLKEAVYRQDSWVQVTEGGPSCSNGPIDILVV